MADDQITLADIGIDLDGGFADFLAGMREKAEAFVRENPPTTEVNTPDDYRYAKKNLAELRRISKEARDGRSRITKVLDAAKKQVMGVTSESIGAVEDAIKAEDAVIKGYEAKARACKKKRLREYWERTYPALALCVAGDPLLPFDELFDPAWTKLMSKVGDDREACADMDAVADSIAAGQQALAELDVDADLRDAAVSELCRTRDLGAAIKRAKDEQARRESARIIREQQEQAAQEDAPEPEQEPADEAQAVEGSEAPAGNQREPVDAGPVYVVTIECRGDDELQHVLGVMRGNGVHGTVRRIA